MNKKLTNEAAVELYHDLNKFGGKLDKYFVLAIEKTKKNLLSIVKFIDEKHKLVQDHKGYVEFETERSELNKKFAEKNEAGEPIIEGNQFKILDSNREAWSKAFEKLAKKHKEALDFVENVNKEIEDWRTLEVEVDITEVSFDRVPDQITREEYKSISLLIKED